VCACVCVCVSECVCVCVSVRCGCMCVGVCVCVCCIIPRSGRMSSGNTRSPSRWSMKLVVLMRMFVMFRVRCGRLFLTAIVPARTGLGPQGGIVWDYAPHANNTHTHNVISSSGILTARTQAHTQAHTHNTNTHNTNTQH